MSASPRGRGRWAAALLAGVAVSACHSWTLAEEPFRTVVAGDSSIIVRIGTTDGARYELESPRVVDDTIVAGWRNIGDRRGSRFDRPRVALRDVREVEVQGVSVPRTVGFFAGGLAALVLTGTYVLTPIFDKSGAADGDPQPPRSCVVTATCR